MVGSTRHEVYVTGGNGKKVKDLDVRVVGDPVTCLSGRRDLWLIRGGGW